MININGYQINSRYTNIVSLLRDMMATATLARTKSEAKTLLRLLRYLGVTHMVYDTPMSEHLEMVIPNMGLKNYLYQIQIYNNEPIVVASPAETRTSALVVQPVMFVSDIISRKSLAATIRDWF